MSIEGDIYADEDYYRKKKALEEHGVLVDGRDLVRVVQFLDALALLTGVSAVNDHLRWAYDLRQQARAYQEKQERRRKQRDA